MMESTENIGKQKIREDIISRLSSVYYWPIKLFGFGRLEITHGEIKQKGISSILLTGLVLLLIHLCTCYLIYALTIEIDYLISTETVILLDFLGFHTCVLMSTLIDRKNAALFVNTGIELDAFLGAKESTFMREIFSQFYFYTSCAVGGAQVVIFVVLICTHVLDLAVSLCGAILFLFLYFIYYDLTFFLSLYTSLTLRVRYMNVSIMKLANMKLDYMPKQFPFNTVLWNDKCDESVDFHLRVKSENFPKAFALIFKQLRYLQNCYRFTLLCCVSYLTFGTFITVQSWIIWAKSKDVDLLRILAITGWCELSWAFQFGASLQTDMFQRQINQTTLICTYIQLKPNYPDEIYRLTATIIRMLEFRDPRVSIYDIFYIDTALMLRLTSSIFVYITMQLQIAFAQSPDANVIGKNGTVIN